MRSPKHLLIWLIVIAVAAAVAELTQVFRAPPSEPPKATGGVIAGRARVVDGDSLIVGLARIRLFGIDAPEREQDCRNAAGGTYACGREATRALTSAIAGRAVTCTPVDHDRYDRDVAVCTAEGDDLGEAMVRSGHALDLARHSRRRYADAERDARDARRGLWAGSFDTPAVWRRQQAN